MTVTNVTPPVITGTAKQGQTLVSSAGTWTSDDPLTYAYQWERCDALGANCVDISGATAPQYVLTAADVGSTIRSEVTATEHAPPPDPDPPPPEVLFNGDFETGDKSQWWFEYSNKQCEPVADVTGGRITVITSDGGVTPRQGTYMAKFICQSGDFPCWGDTGTNTTTLRANFDAQVGDDHYLGCSMYIPSNFPFANDALFNIFFEWHGDNNGIAPMQIVSQLQGGQRYFSCVNRYGPAPVPTSGASTRIMQFGPQILGQWVDFVIRTKWSKTGTGLFEGWMATAGNLDFVTSKKFSQAGENWYQTGQTNVYLAVQYYGSPQNNTRIHYKDAIRVGTTWDSVAP